MRSDQPDCTLYVSSLKQYAGELQTGNKGIVFMSSSFIVGLLGKPDVLPMAELIEKAKELSTKEPKVSQQ